MKELNIKIIPINQIERDIEQPRKDIDVSEKDKLFLSIKKIGIQQPIAVSKIDENRFKIMDGHRRFVCAQKLKLKEILCVIHPKLDIGEFERRRFEIQNTRAPWKPLERSESLNRIKEAKGFKSNKELAEFLSLSETTVANSLQLRKQKLDYIELMQKYDLPESYRIQFVRLKPKIRKIRNFEADDIIINIFERVKHRVIRNAKEFRKLGRIFLRASANEAELHEFLSNPDMTIQELDDQTINTSLSLHLEQMIKDLGGSLQNGRLFEGKEVELIFILGDLIQKIEKLVKTQKLTNK